MLTNLRIRYDGQEVSIDLTKTGVGVLTHKGLRKQWVKGMFIDEQNGDISGFVPDLALWVPGYKVSHNSPLLGPFVNDLVNDRSLGRGQSENLELLEEWMDGIRSNDYHPEAVQAWIETAGLTPFHEMADAYVGEYLDTSDFIRDRLEEEVGMHRIPGWLEWDSEACWENLQDEYFEAGCYYFKKP